MSHPYSSEVIVQKSETLSQKERERESESEKIPIVPSALTESAVPIIGVNADVTLMLWLKSWPEDWILRVLGDVGVKGLDGMRAKLWCEAVLRDWQKKGGPDAEQNPMTNPKQPVSLDPKNEFSAESWEKLRKKHNLTIAYAEALTLTDNEIAHFIELSRSPKVHHPLSLAKKLAAENPANKQTLRGISSVLHPPPEPNKCACGGDLDGYYCPGSGFRGKKCKTCGRDYPNAS
jgi:hypothetical protein